MKKKSSQLWRLKVMYELLGVRQENSKTYFEVLDYSDFVIDTLTDDELVDCLGLFDINGVSCSEGRLYCNPATEGKRDFKASFLAGFRGSSYWVLTGKNSDGTSFADLYSTREKVGELSLNLGKIKKVRVQTLWMNITTMCFLLVSEVEKDGETYISRRFFVLKNNKIKCYLDTGLELKESMGSFIFSRIKRSYLYRKSGRGTLRVYTLPN